MNTLKPDLLVISDGQHLFDKTNDACRDEIKWLQSFLKSRKHRTKYWWADQRNKIKNEIDTFHIQKESTYSKVGVHVDLSWLENKLSGLEERQERCNRDRDKARGRLRVLYPLVGMVGTNDSEYDWW